MIQREINKMGDSLYIIIPKPLADLMDLTVGTKVEIDYEKPRLILQKVAVTQGGPT